MVVLLQLICLTLICVQISNCLTVTSSNCLTRGISKNNFLVTAVCLMKHTVTGVFVIDRQTNFCSELFVYSDSNSGQHPNSAQQEIRKKRAYKKHRKAKGSKTVNVPTVNVNESDVRRRMASMFVNTLNSSDPEKFGQFLSKHCTEDFQFQQTLGGSYAPKAHPKVLVMQGKELVAQFWYNRVQTMPDLFYRLENSMVCTYSNTENSKIIANVAFFATRIFDVPITKYIPKQKQQESVEDSVSKEVEEEEKIPITPQNIIPQDTNIGIKRKANSSTVLDTFTDTTTSETVGASVAFSTSEYFVSYLETVPMMPTHLSLDCEGKLVLHLNEDLKIHMMEFHVICNAHTAVPIVYN